MEIIRLVVLFFVIFDPLASFSVFFTATAGMSPAAKRRTALQAVLLASFLSVSFLLTGEASLELFGIGFNDFKTASGLVLVLLGITMVRGRALTDERDIQHTSSQAIAAIIATPLLTGPAAMTTIIVTAREYGRAVTGTAMGLVLCFTAVLFMLAVQFERYLGRTPLRVITTFLGLVTVSWGVKFIRQGSGLFPP